MANADVNVSVQLNVLVDLNEGPLQESDLLDRLSSSSKVEQLDNGSDHITLISLGCYCGPKLTFQRIGRGAETMPFDWIRTNIQGVLHFIRTDFDGFFNFITKRPVPGTKMVMYRDELHSFWHDDPLDAGMRERYTRRFDRFKRLDAVTKPVLFVRVSTSTDEISRAGELLSELTSRFGPHAVLLLVIEFQDSVSGPGLVAGHDNLMVFFLDGNVHASPDAKAPYRAPVKAALDWMVGLSVSATPFESLEEVAGCADPTNWGATGLGGFAAWEGATSDMLPTEVGTATSEPLPAASLPPPLESDLLEKGVDEVNQALEDGITLISLGCFCGPKLTFQKMGRGAETLPFDWLRTSREGIAGFLENDFDGFFNYTSKLPVPGTPMTCFRHDLHSFWHDDPDKEETKQKYRRRIARLQGFANSGRALLFVRAISTTDELLKAEETLQLLTKQFGEQAALLLIVDFQKSSVGPFAVEGLDDLLVYFLESEVHSGENSAAPYRKPVECGIDWINGEELSIGCVEDVAALHRLADETHWGLVGLGGLNAFEHESLLPKRVRPGAPVLSPSSSAVEFLQGASPSQLAAARSATVVSLGYSSGTKLSIQKLELNSLNTPFDWPRFRLQGVTHFLRNEFRDFFDVTQSVVPESTNVMYRSYFHSFWNEDPRVKEVRESYQQGFERMMKLKDDAGLKLFVRVVAGTEELPSAGDLMAALAEKFGERVLLLLIVDFQPTRRFFVLESFPHVLVSFNTIEDHSSGRGAPYAGAIQQFLSWAVGVPMTAGVVHDFESLRQVASHTDWGFTGHGGIPTFEDAPQAASREAAGSQDHLESHLSDDAANGIYPLHSTPSLTPKSLASERTASPLLSACDEHEVRIHSDFESSRTLPSAPSIKEAQASSNGSAAPRKLDHLSTCSEGGRKSAETKCQKRRSASDVGCFPCLSRQD